MMALKLIAVAVWAQGDAFRLGAPRLGRPLTRSSLATRSSVPDDDDLKEGRGTISQKEGVEEQLEAAAKKMIDMLASATSEEVDEVLGDMQEEFGLDLKDIDLDLKDLMQMNDGKDLLEEVTKFAEVIAKKLNEGKDDDADQTNGDEVMRKMQQTILEFFMNNAEEMKENLTTKPCADRITENIDSSLSGLKSSNCELEDDQCELWNGQCVPKPCADRITENIDSSLSGVESSMCERDDDQCKFTDDQCVPKQCADRKINIDSSLSGGTISQSSNCERDDKCEFKDDQCVPKEEAGEAVEPAESE